MGTVVASDFPVADDWRLIPNWIMPWLTGQLRLSDLFHDHHPSLGLHLFYVANATWFGFHQKLLTWSSLLCGIVLAAFLARRLQTGMHGWRTAIVPPLVALLALSTAQPQLFTFPLASGNSIPWLLAYLLTVDALFRRYWDTSVALFLGTTTGIAFGIFHSDATLVFTIATAGVGTLRAWRESPSRRRVTCALVTGLVVGAGMMFVGCRHLAGVPPGLPLGLSNIDIAFLLETTPRYLVQAIAQGLGRFQYWSSTLSDPVAWVLSLGYTVLVGVSARRAIHCIEDRTPFLLLLILGTSLLLAGFSFAAREGYTGGSGEIPRYEGFRMFTSLLILWAVLYWSTSVRLFRKGALTATFVVLLGLTFFRIDAIHRFYTQVPGLIQSARVTSWILVCTDPANLAAVQRLATGQVPGLGGTLPYAFQVEVPDPEDEPDYEIWHYVWLDWTHRFPISDHPDWRVVLLENGLRFLRQHRLAGFSGHPENCPPTIYEPAQ
jgi:hypothetical protein